VNPGTDAARRSRITALGFLAFSGMDDLRYGQLPRFLFGFFWIAIVGGLDELRIRVVQSSGLSEAEDCGR